MFSRWGFSRRASDKTHPEIKKQFSEVVINFSSQYGSSNTQSYTAANLAGEPRIYDKYGDFQEALVLVMFVCMYDTIYNRITCMRYAELIASARGAWLVSPWTKFTREYRPPWYVPCQCCWSKKTYFELLKLPNSLTS